MIQGNSQISVLAMLVRKYGERMPNGGFEMRLSALEITEMSRHGTLQESPDPDGRGMRWQYFPNRTLTIEGHTVPDSKFVDSAGDGDQDVSAKSLPYSDKKGEE